MPQKGKRENGRPGLPSKPTLVKKDQESAPVQTELPGIEQEKLPALERLIKKYQGFKIARMDATKLEVDSKAAVMKAMHNAGLTVYKRPGHFPFKAVLKVKGETLKVEEIDEDEPDTDEDEGDEGENEDGDEGDEE